MNDLQPQQRRNLLLWIQVNTWPWSPTLVNTPQSGLLDYMVNIDLYFELYIHIYIYTIYMYMSCGTATLFSIVVAPFYALIGRVEGLKFP